MEIPIAPYAPIGSTYVLACARMMQPGKLLVLFAASLASLVGAELVLRLLPAAWLYHPPPEALLMVEDPVLGYAMRPGAVAQWMHDHRMIHVEISAEGLRDAPLSEARAASFRAIAVGDSFTFGLGVEHDEAWPEVLEREVAAHLGRSTSVVDAGVPAYSARQMRLRALDLLDRVHPALVVAGLYARSYWRVRQPYAVYGGVLVVSADIPRLAINASGDLIVTPFQPGALREVDLWLKDHLRLPARILASLGPRLWPERTIPWDLGARPQYKDSDYQPALDELAQLHSSLAKRGIPLVILLVNHQEADGSFSPDEFRYNDRVTRFCRERDLPLADPLPRFVSEANHRPIFRTPSDMHWTPLAHRIAAREVMGVLEARGLLARRADGAA